MRSKILASAVMTGLAAVAFAGDGDKHAGDKVAVDDRTNVLPQGVSAKQLNDQEDVCSVLAQATNAAVTKGGLDDMVERLSSADRKRLGEFAERDLPEIDGRIEQIQKNWQVKYGNSFNLNDARIFAGFVVVHEGEITDTAAARTHWPVPVRPTRDVAANSATSADYLENGRNVAVVTVPASHDLPAINVSMLHESIDDWRIDIPDNITGQQIHDNVKTALTSLGDNVASWPASEAEAYRAVGHRLLMAVYDVPMSPDRKSASAGGN